MLCTKSENLKSKSLKNFKIARLWDIVSDSVLSTWLLFIQKEFFQKKVLLEETDQKPVPSFAYYEKTYSITNKKARGTAKPFKGHAVLKNLGVNLKMILKILLLICNYLSVLLKQPLLTKNKSKSLEKGPL